MDFTLVSLFVLTFTSILILPGPNAAFAVGQSLQYGFANSIVVPLGFMLATGIHALFIFSGIGLIIKGFPLFLLFIKWIGVCYLLLLAYKTFKNVPERLICSPKEAPKLKMFTSAVFVSLTNPKALLASFLIYPVFISPEQSYIVQAINLSLCAMSISFLVYASYSFFAAVMKSHLSRSKIADRIIGAIYLGAAGILATK